MRRRQEVPDGHWPPPLGHVEPDFVAPENCTFFLALPVDMNCSVLLPQQFSSMCRLNHGQNYVPLFCDGRQVLLMAGMCFEWKGGRWHLLNGKGLIADSAMSGCPHEHVPRQELPVAGGQLAAAGKPVEFHDRSAAQRHRGL